MQRIRQEDARSEDYVVQISEIYRKPAEVGEFCIHVEMLEKHLFFIECACRHVVSILASHSIISCSRTR